MRPLVSVIVPVYKVEDYLERCLDSLTKQYLSNIEVLIIDDASPDRCGEICNKYALKDLRFKVYHNQENRGLSAARNFGIRMALSDYIMFVDSDDWVEPEFCLEAYQCAVNYQADLVLFGYYQEFRIAGSSKITHKKSAQMERGYVTREKVIDHMILKNGVLTAAWNKLYHKSLFEKSTFPEGYFFEDMGIGYKIIWQASCIYYTDKYLYYYNRYRSDRITVMKSVKARNDWLEMRMKQYRDLSEWGYSPKNLDFLIKNTALSYFIRCNKYFCSPYHSIFKQILQNSSINSKCFTRKRKALFLLFKYCPLLFEVICYMMGKKTIEP